MSARYFAEAPIVMDGALRIAMEFAELAQLTDDMHELTRHVGDAGRALDLPYFAIIHHLSMRRSSPRLIESSNYPAIWSERVVRGRLYLDDPMILASQRTLTAFAWTDAGRLVRLTARRRHIAEQGHREGLGEGITIPAHIPGEPNGSCSFATRFGRPLPRGENLLCAHLVGIHAFERARQLHGYPAPIASVPHLSPREHDCIRCLVGGFSSDKAIARQLGLSPNTVERYMKTARRAYGGISRTDLIVRALADGTATFDDAIPRLR
jgi:LuxR family quorum-sensing system transcriptional regulator CciR